MRRKLGLLGRTAATAAATAATNSDTAASSSTAAAAAAGGGGGPASGRPSWPLAADASPQVVAAAAAVAAAPLQPGPGGLDEADDKLIADLLLLMEETGEGADVCVGGGGDVTIMQGFSAEFQQLTCRVFCGVRV